MNNIKYIELIETLVTEINDPQHAMRFEIYYHNYPNDIRSFKGMIQQDVIYYAKLPLEQEEVISMLVDKLAKFLNNIYSEEECKKRYVRREDVMSLEERKLKIKKEHGIV
jgi:hypothetical protein